MAKFKIPVEWSVYGVVEIEANSIEEAVNKFDETIDDIPLPDQSEYIDDSFKRNTSNNLNDDIEYYKKMQKFL